MIRLYRYAYIATKVIIYKIVIYKTVVYIVMHIFI